MMDNVLQTKLPMPYLASGKEAPSDIVPEGIIHWGVVSHLWVLEMESDDGPVYAPCVVFFDDTWSKIGPVSSLEAARQTCHRWAAIHDSTVRDMARPRRQIMSQAEATVDIEPSELDADLPGDPWSYDERIDRFRLNLVALGINIANDVLGEDRSLAQLVDALGPALTHIESIFRACGVIQPHYVAPWLARVREAAVFWLTEMDAVDALETDEDLGRSMADEVRRGNVTLNEALSRLADDILDYYKYQAAQEARKESPASRARTAMKAGADRLTYFATDVLVRQAMGGLE
ncbi:hypothetical protein [Gluconacetobacter diazotrophicus]|uniref:Uncharacterized protein n=1 Tax=Gluconacetobacter diazotrophicus (strain ATCC 49037 / DSM 5601 / CCUG 37298 / CIP 103539 / LMG 7603 / PAl5) TaxID=272568 RepID=A9H6S7_GLUDA|nr:hypothetical protein [Gluconacetobacter diazotrophicus]CAP57541.1 hypothetical protein GDI3598 [Gluconacetobacter diazotrophicus PA1 5]